MTTDQIDFQNWQRTDFSCILSKTKQPLAATVQWKCRAEESMTACLNKTICGSDEGYLPSTWTLCLILGNGYHSYCRRDWHTQNWYQEIDSIVVKSHFVHVSSSMTTPNRIFLLVCLTWLKPSSENSSRPDWRQTKWIQGKIWWPMKQSWMKTILWTWSHWHWINWGCCERKLVFNMSIASTSNAARLSLDSGPISGTKRKGWYLNYLWQTIKQCNVNHQHSLQS